MKYLIIGLNFLVANPQAPPGKYHPLLVAQPPPQKIKKCQPHLFKECFKILGPTAERRGGGHYGSHSATLDKSKLTQLVFCSDTGKVTVILLSLGKTLGNSHRVCHKSFSMIQSAWIKNWVPQLISRLQRSFIPFCNTFF